MKTNTAVAGKIHIGKWLPIIFGIGLLAAGRLPAATVTNTTAAGQGADAFIQSSLVLLGAGILCAWAWRARARNSAMASIRKFASRAGLALALVATSGCTGIQSYYAITDHARLSEVDLQPTTNKLSVELNFEFLSRGNFSGAVTEKWRPHIVQFLEGTSLFSKINRKGTPSDCSMHIRMDNVVDSLAGAYAQGFFSGLTLGTVGTKVTDNYLLTTRLVNRQGESANKEYHYGLTSTSGLIKGSVKNATPYKHSDGAFQEILDQFLLKWLIDLQTEGRFQPAPNQTQTKL